MLPMNSHFTSPGSPSIAHCSHSIRLFSPMLQLFAGAAAAAAPTVSLWIRSFSSPRAFVRVTVSGTYHREILHGSGAIRVRSIDYIHTVRKVVQLRAREKWRRGLRCVLCSTNTLGPRRYFIIPVSSPWPSSSSSSSFVACRNPCRCRRFSKVNSCAIFVCGYELGPVGAKLVYRCCSSVNNRKKAKLQCIPPSRRQAKVPNTADGIELEVTVCLLLYSQGWKRMGIIQ